MIRKRPHIFIVDDEERICTSLTSILTTYGYEASAYDSVEALLKALAAARPDLILLDVRMPGVDGLEAQKLLAAREDSPPVIIMSGHGDIAMAVAAVKAGAHDFIEKPIDDEKLAASIAQALAQDAGKSGLAERLAKLSPRERSVAALVVKGYSTIAIAGELGISNRTVDHHRASILAKMEATSLPQLISLLMDAGLHKK
ncbi:response regulator transcription factor [Aestuariivirga sp.]|uniref:response regulator transcription factor n=1 Tax=Aestuariivirga sp. TaxID=2650926 RepID=UPI0039E2F07C